MNYRHAFHAGNHADVLKHVVLLAWLDRLLAKETPAFVLDTHGGRGEYALDDGSAARTGEAAAGIGRLWGLHGLPAAVERLCTAVRAFNGAGELRHYPGSPRLTLAALRPQDRLAACELHPEEAAALRAALAGDPRAAVHARDGYEAARALLPPKEKRGLVLIDPPYEAQEAEYPRVLEAVATALSRWPTAGVAVWYPIKQRRSLHGFLREATALAPRGLLCAELLVRPDDSPLRLNGSGMLCFHPPWKLDETLAPALPVLARRLGEQRPSHRLEWLRPLP
ncbi:23S rRNA (adenine(2030)-N(6))-methyltransferase RlmJ [Silanimonas lenta]|uniref:23S rRNA (adenine(2030)-N(6))-methyltransferase RlmJ n=2 Tax=Silanimonas lenta TaxID=265429 RepID=UPI000403079C|nr:23S rRNA (adenine(2030)-N(6))-methyltransferase RlmJ [Silanimonas lenta]